MYINYIILKFRGLINYMKIEHASITWTASLAYSIEAFFDD